MRSCEQNLSHDEYVVITSDAVVSRKKSACGTPFRFADYLLPVFSIAVRCGVVKSAVRYAEVPSCSMEMCLEIIMNRIGFCALAALSLLMTSATPQDRKEEGKFVFRQNPDGKGPDLRFKEDGQDLLVQLTIEGPAARQVIVTDHSIFDGTPPWDEPPIGVEKPRRPPQVWLRYFVMVNSDLPGFMEKGLMTVPTPEFIREKQRNEVIWRLRNYKNWGFRKEEATFFVESGRFEASSEQWREAIPQLKKTIDAAEARLKDAKAP